MKLKEIEAFLNEMRVRKSSHLHAILVTIFSGGDGYTLRPKKNGGWYNHSDEVIIFLQGVGAGYLLREREEITRNGFVHYGYLITMDDEAIKEFDDLRKGDDFLYSNQVRIFEHTPKHLQGAEISKLISSMESIDVFEDFIMYSDAINSVQINSALADITFNIEAYDSYCRKDETGSHQRWFYYMENREVHA